MMIVFFLMLLGLGCWIAYRLIAPELNLQLNLSRLRLPWQRERLSKDIVQLVKPAELIDEPASLHIAPEPDYQISENEKLDRLEKLLTEKNTDIERLSTALEAERQHRLQFEKTQQLLQEEILRLKQEVKNIRKVHV